MRRSVLSAREAHQLPDARRSLLQPDEHSTLAAPERRLASQALKVACQAQQPRVSQREPHLQRQVLRAESWV
jgi:hypothetical protein